MMSNKLDKETLNSLVAAFTSTLDSEKAICLLSEDAPISTDGHGLLRRNRELANAAAAVNRLPFELVLAIMSMCQPPKPVASFEGRLQPKKDDHSWIFVTHACRRWRSVALNSPELWRSIQLHSTPRYAGSLALTFLKRSAPLTIELNHTYFKSDSLALMTPIERALLNAFYDRLLQNPDRIKELHLQEDMYPQVADLLGLPMPNLTSLQLCADLDDPIYVPLDEESQANIRRLSLDVFHWAPDTFCFPKLTHLYWATEAGFNEDIAYTYDDFMDLLESCSSTLVELVLSDAGPEIEDTNNVYRKKRKSFRMHSIRNIELYPTIRSAPYMLYPLHGLLLPDTVAITWASSLTIPQLVTAGEDSSILFRLPPPATLFRVTALAICPKDGNCVLENETLYVDICKSNIDHALPALSRYLPNLRTLAIDRTLRKSAFKALVASHCSVTSLHLAYQDSIVVIIAYLETGLFNQCANDDSEEDSEYEGYSGGDDDESDGEGSSESSVSEGDEGANEDIGVVAPIAGRLRTRTTSLPALSRLTIHLGELDIHSVVRILSIDLKKLGVPALHLTDTLCSVRQRRHLKTSYDLKLRAGTIAKGVID